MSSISNYSENNLLNHTLGFASYTPVSTIYMGVSTADPLDDNSGIAEPVGGSYARKAITFDAATGRALVQNVDVTFDQATGTWGDISHFALFDSLAGGNQLGHGDLVTIRNIVSGKTLKIPSGEVIVAYSSGVGSTYLAHKLLDFMFRNQAFAQPTIYMALVETTDVVDADTGATIDEFEMTNYVRKATGSWSEATAGFSTNEALIDSGTLTGTGETLASIALVDSITIGAGNVLFFDNAFDTLINEGESVEYAIGDFIVRMS